MPDHMLTIEEARERGFDLDPLKFHECTHNVDSPDIERGTRFFQSRFYFVARTEVDDALGDDMTWLSIRRNDRKHMQDWRHLQAIKNELTDPEREAVQLYPAESRLLDESNQIHLWVYPANIVLPFGYANRSVLTATELAHQYDVLRKDVTMSGGTPAQRPFDAATERASRTAEEIVENLEDSTYLRTYHRNKGRT